MKNQTQTKDRKQRESQQGEKRDGERSYIQTFRLVLFVLWRFFVCVDLANQQLQPRAVTFEEHLVLKSFKQPGRLLAWWFSLSIDSYVWSLFNSSSNSSLYVFDASIQHNCHHENVNINIDSSTVGVVVIVIKYRNKFKLCVYVTWKWYDSKIASSYLVAIDKLTETRSTNYMHQLLSKWYYEFK